VGEHFRLFGVYDPWKPEIAEKHARSIRYQMRIVAWTLPASLEKVRRKLAGVKDGDRQILRCRCRRQVERLGHAWECNAADHGDKSERQKGAHGDDGASVPEVSLQELIRVLRTSKSVRVRMSATLVSSQAQSRPSGPQR
jgi:hypothetical protein